MADTPRDDRAGVLPVVPARTRAGRWWLDAPLRRKLLLVTLVIVLVWVPPVAVAVVINGQLDEARASTRVTVETAAKLDDVEDSVAAATSPLVRYFVLGFTDLDDARAAREATDPLLADLDALRDGLPAHLEPYGDDLAAAIDALVTQSDRLLEFGAAGGRPANVSADPDVFELDPALAEGLAGVPASTVATAEAVEALEGQIGEDLAAARQDVDRLQRLLVSATLISLVVALVVAAGSSIALTTSVVRRIERLSTNGDRFIRDKPLLPSKASADEVGQLTDKMLFAAELLDARREEAVTATRAKDDFLSRVSHELKTPLTAMIGFAQLLEEDPSLTPGDREDVSRIVDAGHRLHKMIEELLDIRAIESGKLALAIESVPLRESIDEAVALVQSTATGRSIAITVDCPDDAAVLADRRRLRDILLNLLSNAVKFNHEGGRVDLVAGTRSDGTLRVSVSDTGPGIAPDAQRELFTPFERLGAGEAGSDAGGGVGGGVGLALTKRVVEAMGGSIGVDSEVGRGSTFWFVLPTVGSAAGAPGPVAPGATGASDEPGAVAEGAEPQRPRPRNPLVPPPVRARTALGQRWLDASLSRKLSVIVPLMVLVWLPPVVIGLTVNARLDDARAAAAATTDKLGELDSLQDSVQASVTPMQTYMALGLSDARLVEVYRATSASIPAEIATVEDGLPGELAGTMRRLEDDIGALLGSLDAIVELGAEPAETGDGADTAVSFELNTPRAQRLVSVVTDNITATNDTNTSLEELERGLETAQAADRREVDDLQRLLGWATFASMVVAVAIAAGGSFAVTNSAVRRIELLSENADRFIRRTRLLPSVVSADEIGQLTDKMMYAGTLLDQRREQAVAATRAKDGFLMRVSRELTTPLTTMIALAGPLAAKPDLSPESHEDAGHIVSAGNHLQGLIEEMLDIKAIEAGELAITTEPVTVQDTADEVVTLVRSMPASRSIAIATDCPAGIRVAADRRRLREILLNLLSNAVKYNRPGGRVDLSVTRQDTTVRLSVTDTGPGIGPDEQKRLFKPFERLTATTTDIEGSGVGLALTKHVVEAMRGTIGVDSEVGRGSTFWFTLPAADGTSRSGADDRVSAPGPGSG